MSKDGPYIGLDFGSQTIRGYVWKNGRAQTIPGGTFASVVALVDHLMHGRDAVKELDTRHCNAVRHLSAAMGTRRPITIEHPRSGPRDVDIDTLAAFLLDVMRKLACAAMGFEITKAIVSLPAGLNTVERQRLAAAAQAAGFTKFTMLPSPAMAAVYWAHCTRVIGTEDLNREFLVVDVGCRFCTVAIVKMSPGQTAKDIKVDLCDTRALRSGSYSIDLAFSSLLQGSSEVPVTAMINAAENAKKELSALKETAMAVKDDRRIVTRDELHRSSEVFLENLKALVRAAMVGYPAVTLAILVGGGSRSLALQDYLKSAFKLTCDIVDCDFAAVMGAAVTGNSEYKVEVSDRKAAYEYWVCATGSDGPVKQVFSHGPNDVVQDLGFEGGWWMFQRLRGSTKQPDPRRDELIACALPGRGDPTPSRPRTDGTPDDDNDPCADTMRDPDRTAARLEPPVKKTIFIRKSSPTEPLGLALRLVTNYVVIVDVKASGAAHKHGFSVYAGWLLTHVCGKQVTDIRQISTECSGKTDVELVVQSPADYNSPKPLEFVGRFDGGKIQLLPGGTVKGVRVPCPPVMDEARIEIARQVIQAESDRKIQMSQLSEVRNDLDEVIIRGSDATPPEALGKYLGRADELMQLAARLLDDNTNLDRRKRKAKLQLARMATLAKLLLRVLDLHEAGRSLNAASEHKIKELESEYNKAAHAFENYDEQQDVDTSDGIDYTFGKKKSVRRLQSTIRGTGRKRAKNRAGIPSLSPAAAFSKTAKLHRKSCVAGSPDFSSTMRRYANPPSSARRRQTVTGDDIRGTMRSLSPRETSPSRRTRRKRHTFDADSESTGYSYGSEQSQSDGTDDELCHVETPALFGALQDAEAEANTNSPARFGHRPSVQVTTDTPRMPTVPASMKAGGGKKFSVAGGVEGSDSMPGSPAMAHTRKRSLTALPRGGSLSPRGLLEKPPKPGDRRQSSFRDFSLDGGTDGSASPDTARKPSISSASPGANSPSNTADPRPVSKPVSRTTRPSVQSSPNNQLAPASPNASPSKPVDSALVARQLAEFEAKTKAAVERENEEAKQRVKARLDREAAERAEAMAELAVEKEQARLQAEKEAKERQERVQAEREARTRAKTDREIKDRSDRHAESAREVKQQLKKEKDYAKTKAAQELKERQGKAHAEWESKIKAKAERDAKEKLDKEAEERSLAESKEKALRETARVQIEREAEEKHKKVLAEREAKLRAKTELKERAEKEAEEKAALIEHRSAADREAIKARVVKDAEIKHKRVLAEREAKVKAKIEREKAEKEIRERAQLDKAHREALVQNQRAVLEREAAEKAKDVKNKLAQSAHYDDPVASLSSEREPNGVRSDPLSSSGRSAAKRRLARKAGSRADDAEHDVDVLSPHTGNGDSTHRSSPVHTDSPSKDDASEHDEHNRSHSDAAAKETAACKIVIERDDKNKIKLSRNIPRVAEIRRAPVSPAVAALQPGRPPADDAARLALSSSALAAPGTRTASPPPPKQKRRYDVPDLLPVGSSTPTDSLKPPSKRSPVQLGLGASERSTFSKSALIEQPESAGGVDSFQRSNSTSLHRDKDHGKAPGYRASTKAYQSKLTLGFDKDDEKELLAKQVLLQQKPSSKNLAKLQQQTQASKSRVTVTKAMIQARVDRRSLEADRFDGDLNDSSHFQSSTSTPYQRAPKSPGRAQRVATPTSGTHNSSGLSFETYDQSHPHAHQSGAFLCDDKHSSPASSLTPGVHRHSVPKAVKLQHNTRSPSLGPDGAPAAGGMSFSQELPESITGMFGDEEAEKFSTTIPCDADGLRRLSGSGGRRGSRRSSRGLISSGIPLSPDAPAPPAEEATSDEPKSARAAPHPDEPKSARAAPHPDKPAPLALGESPRAGVPLTLSQPAVRRLHDAGGGAPLHALHSAKSAKSIVSVEHRTKSRSSSHNDGLTTSAPVARRVAQTPSDAPLSVDSRDTRKTSGSRVVKKAPLTVKTGSFRKAKAARGSPEKTPDPSPRVPRRTPSITLPAGA
eukprot:gene10424-16066_t